MENYNFLFKDQNINNSYLYEYFIAYNDENFLNKIEINQKLIPFILSNRNLLINLFKKDPLFIYTIIDYLYDNKNKINILKENINNLLNQKNLNFLEQCWTYISNNNTNITMQKNLLDHIIIHRESYFFFLFNQIWLNKEQYLLSLNDLSILSKQILIMYYYNLFYTEHKNNIRFESETYQEFIKLLHKYKSVYVLDKEPNISFKQIDENIIKSDKHIDKIKSFFKFCLDNKIINKNIITWYFILLIDYIPTYLYNDFYYIILNISKNNLGIISKILSYFNLDYYELDEQKLNKLYQDISENNDYLSNIIENLSYNNDIDYDEITNNILLIIKLKQFQDQPYLFLQNIKIDDLLDYYYFGLCILSPLENAWITIILQIKVLYREIINKINIYFNQTLDKKILNDEILEQIIKIYNSSICTNFKGTYNLLSLNISPNVLKIEKIENIENNDIFLNIFNLSYLFYNFLNYLYSFGIIPIKGQPITDIINLYLYNIDTLIQLYLNIYPQQQKYLTEYMNNK